MSDSIKDDFGDPIHIWCGGRDVVVLEPDPTTKRFVFTAKQSRKLRKALKRAEKRSAAEERVVYSR